MFADYQEYLRAEWDMFFADPARGQASLDAVAGRDTARVLDIGCGAGQELMPFISRGSSGVGIDVHPQACGLGRRLFALHNRENQVTFTRAAAEQLPFRSATFDVLICRLALPYSDSATALTEMSRVLKPGGVLLLTIHHVRYYLRTFWIGLRERNLRSMAHARRAIVAGLVYHLTGKQPGRENIPSETFQSRWLLRRELARRSLAIEGEMPLGNPRAPSLVIRKNLIEPRQF